MSWGLMICGAALIAGACRDRPDPADLPRDITRAERLEMTRKVPYEIPVEEGLGLAIAVVVDTSGSMSEIVPDGIERKSTVARAAIGKALEATKQVAERRPDFPIKVGLFAFSDKVQVVMPIKPYDHDKLMAALSNIPYSSGGTAIGTALDVAREHLYQAGVYRKHILVITDGMNSDGPDPGEVARTIHARSEGAVQMHFIAFDIDPERFGFVEEVKGQVIGAKNPAELQKALNDIYAEGILAEATETIEPPPSGETTTRQRQNDETQGSTE